MDERAESTSLGDAVEKKLATETPNQTELSSVTLPINQGAISIGEYPYEGDELRLYAPIMETLQEDIKNHPEIANLASILPLLEQKNSPEAPLPFWYSQPLFPIVMRELLVNALRAVRETPDRTGSITVKSLFDKKTNEFSVSISDTGKGIPEDIKDTLFHEGYTTKPYGDNIGNGLFRSKKAIEHLGGILEASDNKRDLGKDKGATFTIKVRPPRS